MPIIKSAKKALRQAERRRVQNLARKDAIREVVRKIKKLVASNKHDEALALLPQAYKAMDKAAKTNVLHRNTASRKKSRLVKFIRRTKV
ncbi:MAG: 30S ribosomal protein S20 [Patescibacteria group bacterium]